jgi:hypothetical protein
MNNRLTRLNIERDQEREHMSDIEGQTDPDGVQSEADKEKIRQIFGVSHALETFDDYKEIKQGINQDTTLSVYSHKDKILSIIETNSITIIQGNTGSRKATQILQYILDDYVKHSKPCNIVVTQSRYIAARSLCEHISRGVSFRFRSRERGTQASCPFSRTRNLDGFVCMGTRFSNDLGLRILAGSPFLGTREAGAIRVPRSWEPGNP